VTESTSKPSQARADDDGVPPLLTVVVCTRNRAGFLRLAVESVLRQMRSDAEILIVDNASTDETADVAAEWARQHPCLRVYREPELGLSAARNSALRLARGKYVVFLDDDAQAEPGWLVQYASLFGNPPAPELGGAGGSVFPWYDAPLPRWVRPEANRFDWSDRPQVFKPRGGPWGCNFAVHRERALKLGGFNTALGRKGSGLGAHEESELFEKFKQTEWSFWWLPEARIRHHVAVRRLTFAAQCRGAFCNGRSAALYRLRLRRPGVHQMLFRAARALGAPFQCATGVCAALLIAPFCRLHRAASLLFQAARGAGFAFQLFCPTGPSPSIPAPNSTREIPAESRGIQNSSSPPIV
jgi:hypothetical protein